MTRPAEIADYLLSTSLGDTEVAWAAEVNETIAARWPDATPAELTAAFEIVMLSTAADVIEATTRALRRAAERATGAQETTHGR